jgi:hypothetical protein
MIGLFSVFGVMEPQGNYMEELYTPGEYKLIWMLCCYFFCVARILYISNMHVLQLIKYILELRRTLFCENVCLLTR